MVQTQIHHYFYTNIISQIQDIFTEQPIIIAGDFNLILIKDLDSMNYKNLNKS